MKFWIFSHKKPLNLLIIVNTIVTKEEGEKEKLQTDQLKSSDEFD